MKFLALALSLFATSLLAQTVQNPSFENYTQTASGGGCGYNTGPIPGWAASGSFGQAQCDSTVYAAAPNGSTIAWSLGATITQDLGTTPTSTYAFTVSIGHRLDGYQTGSTATVSVLSGGTPICSQSVVTVSVPAGGWQAVNLNCPYTASANNPVISLACSGGECLYDNVSFGQHSAVLTWTDTVNPSGTQYNIYRSAGTATYPLSCNSFTKLNSSPVSALTYTDTTINITKMYCYEVRAINGGTESIAGDSLFTVVQ